jgi:hypothetical protein
VYVPSFLPSLPPSLPPSVQRQRSSFSVVSEFCLLVREFSDDAKSKRIYTTEEKEVTEVKKGHVSLLCVAIALIFPCGK